MSFMWESMNRFVKQPDFETSLDELFGTRAWRDGRERTGDQRKDFLHKLYRDQLKDVARARQVLHFHLFHRNRLRYSIFFGTGHRLGSDKMKEAIWKADPSGDYSFRAGEYNQMSLLQPDFAPLQTALEKRFDGQGWVPIETIEKFMQSDAGT